jgi:hypothetical protein
VTVPGEADRPLGKFVKPAVKLPLWFTVRPVGPVAGLRVRPTPDVPTVIVTPVTAVVVLLKLESEEVKLAVIVWLPSDVKACEHGGTTPATRLLTQNVPETAESLKLTEPV